MAVRDLLTRRNLGAVGVGAGVLLVGWAIFGGPSDEEQIRALLDRLAHEIGSREGETNPILRASRLNQAFEEIFTEDVRIGIPELTQVTRGRRDLVGVAAQAGTYYASAEVTLSDVQVSLNDDETLAQAGCTAVLTAERGGRPRRDQRKVNFTLSKIDGDWLIDGLTVSRAESDG